MAAKSDGEFMRSFARVLLMLCGLTIVLIIIGAIVGSGVDKHPTAQEARIAARLQPVATVVTNPKALMQASADSSASKPALTGEQVVSQVCSACHAAGVLGAPKIGDATEWGKRFKTQGGLNGLVQHAIHGLNQMPPRGGNPALTDQEIHDAVKYMLSKAGIKG